MFLSDRLPAEYWLPPFLAAITTSSLAILIWRRRLSSTAATLGTYLFSVALWSFGYCLQVRGQSLAQQVFWSKVEYLGPAGVSLCGLIFVLQYCGFEGWVRRSRILMLAIIPKVTQILVWTNEQHGLIWRRTWLDLSGPVPLLGRVHGPWFWLFLVYGYGL